VPTGATVYFFLIDVSVGVSLSSQLDECTVNTTTQLTVYDLYRYGDKILEEIFSKSLERHTAEKQTFSSVEEL